MSESWLTSVTVGTLRTLIPGRLRELDSECPEAFSRLQIWLQTCNLRHNCIPREPPKLPTRVLDVGVAGRNVMLMDSFGMSGHYIALSHCWGTSGRIMLTNATYLDLLRGIAISYLPKTFRDAVMLTRKLRVRYLWIDCLCIVQDDAKDWETEASLMGQVYSNAYLTISAADSRDSTTGCFPKRERGPYVSADSISLGYNTPRHTLRPEAFHFGIMDSTGGNLSTMSLFDEWMPGASINWVRSYVIGVYGAIFDPLENESISSRGWTLQERILSPRLIHYAKDQMYWECSRFTKSEDGSVFRPMAQMSKIIEKQRISITDPDYTIVSGISLIRGRSAEIGDRRERYESGWLSYIQNFMRRKLTKEDDRLPALSGLTRVVATATNDKFHAGVWANHVLEDLHWRVYPQEEIVAHTWPRATLSKGKIYGEVRRTQTYRAPSWSWASLEAPIKFLTLNPKHLVADWKEISATPAGLDPNGRVINGFLKIKVSDL